MFFGRFFFVQEKKKKEELPQNEVPDDEFFAQYMCLGRQFVLPWKLDKTCPFPLDDGNRWGLFVWRDSQYSFVWLKKPIHLVNLGCYFSNRLGGCIKAM